MSSTLKKCITRGEFMGTQSTDWVIVFSNNPEYHKYSGEERELDEADRQLVGQGRTWAQPADYESL